MKKKIETIVTAFRQMREQAVQKRIIKKKLKEKEENESFAEHWAHLRHTEGAS